MTLGEYYNSLPKKTSPKRNFKDKVIRDLGVADSTIHFWLNGTTVPNKEIRDYLAKETGIPEGELFPGIDFKNGKRPRMKKKPITHVRKQEKVDFKEAIMLKLKNEQS